MNIQQIPSIGEKPHIYKSYQNNKLVIFVGAGVSALWGCSRWNEMAKALVCACYRIGEIDYFTKETLISKYAHNPRKLITYAKEVLRDKYISELKNTLNISKEKQEKLPNLLDNLFQFNAMYITTNIDTHFSKLFDKDKIHTNPAKFVLKPNNIVQLHGNIEDQNSLIMTVDEYIKMYRDNKDFKEFLENTFFDKDKCILFIGYGVEEMEIIDFLVQKYGNDLKRYINNFYILMPFFQHEVKILDCEEKYFNQINMSVIPYAIDLKGYEQLDVVLSSWLNSFNNLKTNDFYAPNNLIERNL